MLMRMAMETSLRYTINLITTAYLAAKRRKSDIVDVADVRRVYSMSFLSLNQIYLWTRSAACSTFRNMQLNSSVRKWRNSNIENNPRVVWLRS